MIQKSRPHSEKSYFNLVATYDWKQDKKNSTATALAAIKQENGIKKEGN